MKKYINRKKVGYKKKQSPGVSHEFESLSILRAPLKTQLTLKKEKCFSHFKLSMTLLSPKLLSRKGGDIGLKVFLKSFLFYLLAKQPLGLSLKFY